MRLTTPSIGMLRMGLGERFGCNHDAHSTLWNSQVYPVTEDILSERTARCTSLWHRLPADASGSLGNCGFERFYDMILLAEGQARKHRET